MRGRIIALLFVFIIISANTSSVKCNSTKEFLKRNDVINNRKPDLIGKVEIIKENDSYFFKHTITNIGNAVVVNWSINTTVYNFGGYFIKQVGIEGPYSPIQYLLMYVLILCHINLVPIISFGDRGDPGWSGRELYPNENYSYTCFFPLPNQDNFKNAHIGLVIECVVDEFNWIDESDETNNKKVYRWWEPYSSEPPF